MSERSAGSSYGRGCREARRALRDLWSDEDAGARSDWLSEHIRSCPACRDEFEELRRIDRALWRGLGAIRARISPPSEDAVRETVRRALEEPPEVQTLRRIRRTVRTVLWGTLFALVLLAAFALAAAVYRALKALP